MIHRKTAALRLGLLALAVSLATSTAAHDKPSAHGHDHMAHAVGKGSAPVKWLSLGEYEAKAGGSVPVNVDFALSWPADQVHVRVSAEQGLRLAEPALEFAFENVAAGPLGLPPIDVAVDATGRHYLNAVVTIHAGSVVRATAVSIPVSTPGAKTPTSMANKSLKTDADGRPVRVMQASEPR